MDTAKLEKLRERFHRAGTEGNPDKFFDSQDARKLSRLIVELIDALMETPQK